jgi:hypothetical protein
VTTADEIAEGVYQAQRRRDLERARARAAYDRSVGRGLAVVFGGLFLLLPAMNLAYAAADAVGLAKACAEHEMPMDRDYVWAWDDCADRPVAVMTRQMADLSQIFETQSTTETTR